MRISSDTLKNLLLSTGKASPEIVSQIEKTATQTGESLDQVALRSHIIGERELVALYAKSINLPYVDLTNIKISRDLLARIPERIAKKYQAILFGQKDNKWQLATADPEDIQAIDVIEKQLGGTVQLYVATTGDILSVLDQYRTGLDREISAAIRESSTSAKAEQSDTVSAEDISEDAPIAKTVNIILEYAIKSRASDVHIEPRENIVQIRYRIDGILRESMTLPRQILPAVVSRIKILANLKIDEHRVPQDGRFKAVVGSKTVAVRVATLPVMDGEKVVMRILDETTRAATLEELGFLGQPLESIKAGIKQPNGMVLVTGPTGSGKSTTLYSVLTMLNAPAVNISTVEDPVEYRIPGVNQTQVNTQAGMTFANGLRSLLRQDPNIIMVGEIRDSETANLAIQAALTGHVVLSTLHTNNAATSLPRLLDMQIEPFLISSTVNTVVAQRLVRKLCDKCKQPYTPTGALLDEVEHNFQIKRILAIFAGEPLQHATPAQPVLQPQPTTPERTRPVAELSRINHENRKVIPVPQDLDVERKSILDRIAHDPNIIDRPVNSQVSDEEVGLESDPSFAAALEKTTQKIEQLPTPPAITNVAPISDGIEELPPASQPNTGPESIVLYRAVGCKACDNSGYTGRLGIYEVLDINDEIAKLIVAKATAAEIQAAGIAHGMITMHEDGFLKCLRGHTTIEEVLRVTRD